MTKRRKAMRNALELHKFYKKLVELKKAGENLGSATFHALSQTYDFGNIDAVRIKALQIAKQGLQK